MRHMQADLMRAARFELAGDKARHRLAPLPRINRHHLVMGDRLPPAPAETTAIFSRLTLERSILASIVPDFRSGAPHRKARYSRTRGPVRP